jgi:hypothetical protein
MSWVSTRWGQDGAFEITPVQMLDALTTSQNIAAHGQIFTTVRTPVWPATFPLLPPIFIGHTLEGNKIAAFVHTKNGEDGSFIGVEESFARIKINRLGGFFRETFHLDPNTVFKEGPYRGGTNRAKVRIILHELAHIQFDQVQVEDKDHGVTKGAAGFLPDGLSGQDDVQKGNSKLIDKYCGTLIEGTLR